MIVEKDVQIQTADGLTEGVLYRHDGSRTAGVIHLTDAIGIPQAHRDVARRLSGAGYTVLMPHLSENRLAVGIAQTRRAEHVVHGIHGPRKEIIRTEDELAGAAFRDAVTQRLAGKHD
jgi:dienelactone hydrolase